MNRDWLLVPICVQCGINSKTELLHTIDYLMEVFEDQI
jgi:hypothetical protein